MHSADEISFDIALRHPSESPDSISRSLGLEAVLSWTAGSKVGTHVHTTTYWNATISASSGDETLDGLLESVVSFFRRNKAFCREFVDSGGEIDLILNGHVLDNGPGEEGAESKPKVFEMTLYPKFLEALTVFPVALTIRMWDSFIPQ